ncbi:MAG: hypothetical protein M0P01_04120 [Treponema sp.]|nr:hypothetical protein [Treponema sp.]
MSNLYRKKILILFSLCLVYAGFLTWKLSADSITLGGKEGWSKLSLRKGVTEGTGRFGYTCIELATNARTDDRNTDALVDFEKRPFSERTGNYSVGTDLLGITTESVMGKGAALGRGRGGMLLKGRAGSVFGTEGPTGSFYIEFWLAPSLSENGEVVFDWRSSRNMQLNVSDSRKNSILYQMITGVFNKNHIEWTFTNVFDGCPEEDIVISGMKNIVPDVWSHHAVSYDEESGRLEYRVDGQLEAVEYVTSTGHESGTVYSLYLGVPADIDLCPLYTGKIDDFRIQRGTYDAALLEESEEASGLGYSKFLTSGGRIETQPLQTSMGTSIDSVSAVMNEPPQTAIMLYVRSGDNFFNWTDAYPEWKPVKNGAKITDIRGLYFQVAADLYPDGDGNTTPSLTQLVINYTKELEPLPPFKIKAVPGDGSVTLTWSYSVDESAGSYLVYYGTRSGEYLGRTALQGPSPVNAGNTTSITITGLKNGTIYYFAVSAGSKFDTRINGQLSQEVYARPFAAGE